MARKVNQGIIDSHIAPQRWIEIWGDADRFVQHIKPVSNGYREVGVRRRHVRQVMYITGMYGKNAEVALANKVETDGVYSIRDKLVEAGGGELSGYEIAELSRYLAFMFLRTEVALEILWNEVKMTYPSIGPHSVIQGWREGLQQQEQWEETIDTFWTWLACGEWSLYTSEPAGMEYLVSIDLPVIVDARSKYGHGAWVVYEVAIGPYSLLHIEINHRDFFKGEPLPFDRDKQYYVYPKRGVWPMVIKRNMQSISGWQRQGWECIASKGNTAQWAREEIKRMMDAIGYG